MKKFEKYSANPENPNWKNYIKRETPLYPRNNDIRNDFERDYTRIIHSNAYRRLKHKTQVFFFTWKRSHLHKNWTCNTCRINKLHYCKISRFKYWTYKSNCYCTWYRSQSIWSSRRKNIIRNFTKRFRLLFLAWKKWTWICWQCWTFGR